MTEESPEICQYCGWRIHTFADALKLCPGCDRIKCGRCHWPEGTGRSTLCKKCGGTISPLPMQLGIADLG